MIKRTTVPVFKANKNKIDDTSRFIMHSLSSEAYNLTLVKNDVNSKELVCQNLCYLRVSYLVQLNIFHAIKRDHQNNSSFMVP